MIFSKFIENKSSFVNQVVKLHQHVTVKVVEVDEDRKRIQLTMVL
jgi:protein Tex